MEILKTWPVGAPWGLELRNTAIDTQQVQYLKEFFIFFLSIIKITAPEKTTVFKTFFHWYMFPGARPGFSKTFSQAYYRHPAGTIFKGIFHFIYLSIIKITAPESLGANNRAHGQYTPSSFRSKLQSTQAINHVRILQLAQSPACQ